MTVVDADRLSALLGIDGDRSLCTAEFLHAAQAELALALALVRQAYVKAAIDEYREPVTP